MLKQTGSRELLSKIKKDIERTKGKITKTHQNLVRNILRDIVVNTPQWSGELAMHWGLEFHGHKAPSPLTPLTSVGFRPWDYYLDGWRPYQAGMEPAVSQTLAREYMKIPEIRYNSIVKIVNRMPYASEVEEGRGPYGRPIREENRLAAYGGVAMIGYVTAKYSNKSEIKKAIVK